MRLLSAIAVLLVAGCTSGGTTAGASPAPSASAVSSPSPVAALPCRMPAFLRVDQGGMRSVLGWLSLPSGATTDDPINHIIVTGDFPVGNGTSLFIWATDHSPQLYGTPSATYSTAAGKWLPVPPELMSPDGLHYSYLAPTGYIQLDGADGTEISVGNPQKLTPLAYTSAGVLLTGSDIASNGLWLLDPTTKSITAVTPPVGNDDWREVSSGAVWGVDSPGVLGYPAPTSVLKVTVPPAGGPVTAYKAAAGNSIALIAADRQGGLLVAVTGSAPALIYIGPGGVPTTVPVPSGVSTATLGPRHHADAHGVWLIGQTGVFLFTPGSGLQSIAPGVTTDIVPGGDCT